MQLLEQAKKRTKHESVITEIDKLIIRISNHKNMQAIIKDVNRNLAEWEQSSNAKSVVNFLKAKHIYRMLYRHPKIQGEEIENDILRKLLKQGYIGVGISLLIIGAFVASMLLAAPFWLTAITSGLFIGSSIYLTTLLYGVLNDLFATHSNLPYFLLGHQPQQRSMLRTNDKIAQGFAWGVAATYGLGLIGAIAVTVAATITAFFVPMATFLLPAVVIGIAVVTIGADIFARIAANKLQRRKGVVEVGSNFYQLEGLYFMSPTVKDKAAWWGNSFRNGFGFFGVPFIFIGSVAAIIVLSGVSMFLPAILFASPILAVITPAAVLACTAFFLLAGGLYTYINRERHVDDRTNLNFENTEINYDLYLDEDQEYAEKLVFKASSSNNNTIRFFAKAKDEVDEEEELKIAPEIHL
ncbi:MAG: hypothetical protein Q8M03_02640 [Legionella sp.]|nr:hypothetical protein [Legionella sp.]